jgi:hypothetical protein
MLRALRSPAPRRRAHRHALPPRRRQRLPHLPAAGAPGPSQRLGGQRGPARGAVQPDGARAARGAARDRARQLRPADTRGGGARVPCGVHAAAARPEPRTLGGAPLPPPFAARRAHFRPRLRADQPERGAQPHVPRRLRARGRGRRARRWAGRRDGRGRPVGWRRRQRARLPLRAPRGRAAPREPHQRRARRLRRRGGRGGVGARGRRGPLSPAHGRRGRAVRRARRAARAGVRVCELPQLCAQHLDRLGAGGAAAGRRGRRGGRHVRGRGRGGRDPRAGRRRVRDGGRERAQLLGQVRGRHTARGKRVRPPDQLHPPRQRGARRGGRRGWRRRGAARLLARRARGARPAVGSGQLGAAPLARGLSAPARRRACVRARRGGRAGDAAGSGGRRRCTRRRRGR